nr:polysaccharide biosynthesis C-terminal domain-containing protein [Natrononativus amylolyticus]
MLSIIAICMIFLSEGIFDGCRKYIGEDPTSTDWATNVFGFYFRIALLLIVLTIPFIIVFTYAGFVQEIFSKDFVLYFYILPAVLFAQQMFTVVRGTLMGFNLEHRSEPLLIVQAFVWGVLSISLAYLGYGVFGVLVGHVISLGLAALLGFTIIFSRINIKNVIGGIPSSFPRQQLLLFNSLSVILALFMTSLYHVDILLLRIFVGSTQTGYYKAALVVAEFLWFAPIAVQMVYLQSSSEMWTKGEYAEINSLISQTTRYTLLFTLLIAIGIASLTRPFIQAYFGPDFTPAALPLLILLPGSLGLALARPIYAIGQGKGDLQPLLYATGTAASINIVLNLALIPTYGMTGAAAATSIGYGSMFVFHTLAARRIGFNPIRDIRAQRVIATAVVAGPAIFGLAAIIPSDTLSLLVVPPVGFVIYFGVAVGVGALDFREISYPFKSI